MHTAGLLGWVKMPDIETVQISIIWLNLVGIGYDLNDIQDGLKCWRMGFIFCGLGPMVPLVTIVINGKSRMSTRLLHLGWWEKNGKKLFLFLAS